MQPRYTLIEVENRGHRVAVIEDRQANEVLRVRQKGQRFLRWDRNDEVVTDAELRRVARGAFEADFKSLPDRDVLLKGGAAYVG